MSRLEHATRTLQSAIDRLEQAAEERASANELVAALERAREEKDALQDATVTVSRRLDSAILRLKAALES